jgi:hypothetical protein
MVGVLTGVAAMGYRPGERWLDAIAAAAATHAPHTSGAQLAAVGGALRGLGYDASKAAGWIVEA